MSGRVQRALRGFLVHDGRVDLDHLADNDGSANGSMFTEADPQPGTAVASDALTSYSVRAHNAQIDDITVRVVRPGLPSTDQGAVLYRETAEAASASRGWNEPNLFQSWEPVDWSTTLEWTRVDAVTIPSTQQVVVVGCDTLAGVDASSWTWSPTTRTWGARVSVSGDAGQDLCAIVILARTERLLALRCDASDGTLRTDYSDDAGTTWLQYDRDTGGGVTIDSSVAQLTAVQDRHGNVMLMGASTTTGDWWLYRSEDEGATYTEVETGAAEITRPKLLRMIDGRVLVVYREFSTNDAKSLILADAYDDIASKTASAVAINGTTNVEFVAPCVDADGAVYVYLSGGSPSDQVAVARSVDNATSWTVYTEDAVRATMVAVPTDYATRIRAAVCSGGEVVTLGNTLNADGSPTTDGSLISLVFGGWSTLEARGGAVRTARRSFAGSGDESSVFLPSDTFDNIGWTLSDATAVHTVTNGFWRFNASGTVSYGRLTSATALTGGSCVLTSARIASAAVVTTILTVERAGYEIQVRADEATLEVWDSVAGTQIGASIDVDMTERIDIAVVFADDDVVTVFYKLHSSSVWIKGPQEPALTAAVGNNQRYTVGVQDSVSTDLRVWSVALGDHALLTGVTDDAPYLNDLSWGKALTTVPYPVRDQGTSSLLHISAAGGSARHAETFAIAARHDHPMGAMLPQEHPSYDVRWRSTGSFADPVKPEHIFAWDLTGSAIDTRIGSSWSLALCLVATNFRSCTIETRTAAGSWTEIGEWDATVLEGASYQIAGEVLRPNGGVVAPTYWGAGQLAGGHVILDPGGSEQARRIVWNSPGTWGTDHPPVLRLTGVDGTEPATGTCDVIAPGGVLVLHQQTPAVFRRVRIRIPDQSKPDAYYEIGGLILGAVVVPGRQWSRGYSWREEPVISVETDDTGAEWVTERGPVRRELTVSWQDGYDISAVRRGDAPHLSPAVGHPSLVADQDVWWQLAGLQRESRGGALPVVAIGEVPSASGMVLDPTLWLAGTLTGRVQANHVQGADGRTEVVRVESVTVREQPWTRVAS